MTKRHRLQRGFIQVYTGNGKGKTTAALGLVLRAAGAGLTTCMVQLMKDYPYAELQSLRRLKPWVRLKRYGNDKFARQKNPPGPEDLRAARQALNQARRAMISGEYDLVVLDEICVAIYCGLLTTEAVVALLEEKPRNVELILTGRYCPQQLIEQADLVSEMLEVKHYYQKRVIARAGIEC